MSSIPLLSNPTIKDLKIKINDIIINTDNLLKTKSPLVHNHDDRYYTIHQANNALNSSTGPEGHTHLIDDIIDISTVGSDIFKSTSTTNLKDYLEIDKADVGLSEVQDTSDDSKLISNAANTILNNKTTIISPDLTLGIPRAPTASSGVSSDQIATTAFVKTITSSYGPASESNNTEFWTGATSRYVSPAVSLSAMAPVNLTETNFNITRYNATTSAGFSSVCYGTPGGNPLFVAVGGSRIMTSPDGITWTARTSPEVSGWKSVCYGPVGAAGLFVAVSGAGPGYPSHIMTSPDGITWTVRTPPEVDATWDSVCYGNGLFVINSIITWSGYVSGVILTSPNGITWTSRTKPTSTHLSVCYGNGIFVGVTADGTNDIMTSLDGITWTSSYQGISGRFSSVCYGTPGGNPLFVAVHNSDGATMISNNGVDWVIGSTVAGGSRNICYGDGMFVMTGFFPPGLVYISPDGLNWTAQTISGADPLKPWASVCYGNGKFIAVSEQWDGLISGTVLNMTRAALSQINLNSGRVFNINITEDNKILKNPLNMTPGESGIININNPNKFNMILESYWKFSGGSSQVTWNSKDTIEYYVLDTTTILCNKVKVL